MEQGTIPQAGQPVMAKATAAAPSLSEGTAGFLSLDLSGNLRATIGAVSVSSDATATAAAPTYTEGQASPLSQNLTGDLRTVAKQSGTWNVTVNSALAAGTNIIGQTGIDQTTPGTTNGVAPNAVAAAGGIPSTARLLSAANTTNGTNVKGSAGRVYAIQGYNAAAAVRYLKLYNKATTPAVGTDTPVKTIAIPGTTVFALDWPIGYSFATGIGFGLSTGSADNDTGALTAGDILGLNIDYA